MLHPNKDHHQTDVPGHGEEKIDEQVGMGCNTLSAKHLLSGEEYRLDNSDVEDAKQDCVAHGIAAQPRQPPGSSQPEDPPVETTGSHAEAEGPLFRHGLDKQQHNDESRPHQPAEHDPTRPR